MYCTKCGAPIQQDGKFCAYCGARVVDRNSIYSKKSDTEIEQQYNHLYGTHFRDNINDYKAKVDQDETTEDEMTEDEMTEDEMTEDEMTEDEMTEDDIPDQYRPLGAWTYFGLNVLFSIPIIGFIFLLICSFSDQNINRRNFARSYWCIYVIYAILFFLYASKFLIFLSAVN